MLKLDDVRGLASVSNFAKITEGESFAAAWANAGAIMRHGPHHGAQKSTRTGTSFRPTNFAKETSLSSTGLGGNSSERHLPHTGWSPRFDAGTRLTDEH